MAEDVDVLVIMPHADDAEYGVAGTVARWTREGCECMQSAQMVKAQAIQIWVLRSLSRRGSESKLLQLICWV